SAGNCGIISASKAQTNLEALDFSRASFIIGRNIHNQQIDHFHMETVQPKKLWIITRILPSLSDVLFVSLLFAVYLLGGRMLNIDSDLGRHLAIGDFILDTGSIPTKDILSHTREGNHRPPYEWFSQVLLAGTHRIGGLAGVIFLTGLIISATFTILYGEAVKRTGLPILSAFLIILIAGASSLHWLPRPHIFTFI